MKGTELDLISQYKCKNCLIFLATVPTEFLRNILNGTGRKREIFDKLS